MLPVNSQQIHAIFQDAFVYFCERPDLEPPEKREFVLQKWGEVFHGQPEMNIDNIRDISEYFDEEMLQFYKTLFKFSSSVFPLFLELFNDSKVTMHLAIIFFCFSYRKTKRYTTLFVKSFWKRLIFISLFFVINLWKRVKKNDY